MRDFARSYGDARGIPPEAGNGGFESSGEWVSSSGILPCSLLHMDWHQQALATRR